MCTNFSSATFQKLEESTHNSVTHHFQERKYSRRDNPQTDSPVEVITSWDNDTVPWAYAVAPPFYYLYPDVSADKPTQRYPPTWSQATTRAVPATETSTLPRVVRRTEHPETLPLVPGVLSSTRGWCLVWNLTRFRRCESCNADRTHRGSTARGVEAGA